MYDPHLVLWHVALPNSVDLRVHPLTDVTHLWPFGTNVSIYAETLVFVPHRDVQCIINFILIFPYMYSGLSEVIVLKSGVKSQYC